MRARRLGGKASSPQGLSYRGLSGFEKFTRIVRGGGTIGLAARLDIAVFTGLGEGDAEDQDAEEWLGENVADLST